MAGNLTTPVTIPNGTRLIFGPFSFDDDNGVLTVPVQLRTAPSADALICQTTMVIRDGESTKIARQASPAVGLGVEDIQRHLIITTRTTPTGYTDAFTAMRAATNTKGARRTALEAHMLSVGHVDATLAYT